jgi:hypothetical protein
MTTVGKREPFRIILTPNTRFVLALSFSILLLCALVFVRQTINSRSESNRRVRAEIAALQNVDKQANVIREDPVKAKLNDEAAPTSTPLGKSRFVGDEARSTRQIVVRSFAPLVSELGLSPDAQRRLYYLLSERELARREAKARATENKLRSPDAIDKAMNAVSAQFEIEINGILPSDGSLNAAALISLEKSYKLARSIGLDMGFAGVPLTSADTVALAKLMNEVGFSPDNKDYRALISTPADPVSGLNPMMAQLSQASAAILSQEQRQVLNEFQKEINAVLSASHLSPERLGL